jgi:hypothetical protein
MARVDRGPDFQSGQDGLQNRPTVAGRTVYKTVPQEARTACTKD